MHFELDDDQEAVVRSVATLLDRHAGPARAREMGGDEPAYDSELEAALGEGGFLDLHGSDEVGPLGAALVTEAVARAAGVAAVGARALVLPALVDVSAVEGPVALVREGHGGPVRFASVARTVVVVGETRARVLSVDTGAVEPVAARCGFPMGRYVNGLSEGEDVGAAAAPRALAWWRVSLAAETVGTMVAALDITLDHVRERHQFGRPIGSFQAIQHRLAELAVGVEASRWLVLEAAWSGASEEAAAVALTEAAATAKQLFPELHQFTGAIGFTTEYDLHLWTMRLPALWLEAEWIGRPDEAVAAARWAAEAV